MKSQARGGAGARDGVQGASEIEQRPPRAQRVLVGIDGAEENVPRIIDAAFEVAARSGSRIWLVEAVGAPDPGGCVAELVRKRRAAIELLLRRHPGAPVERLIVQSGAFIPLVTAAASLCVAQVLVLGAKHVRLSSSSARLRDAVVPWGGTLLVVCDRPGSTRLDRPVPLAL